MFIQSNKEEPKQYKIIFNDLTPLISKSSQIRQMFNNNNNDNNKNRTKSNEFWFRAKTLTTPKRVHHQKTRVK